MDSHFMQKVSHLLPSPFSSCSFRNCASDVIGSSIFITRNQTFYSSTTTNLTNTLQKNDHKPNTCLVSRVRSSSSKGGWFSSQEEAELDGKAVSLRNVSSGSSESFSRKTTKHRRRASQKSFRQLVDQTIDFHGSSEESSAISSTDLYYSDFGGFRRRKAAKSGRRKTGKKCRRSGKDDGFHAVEKSSTDPYSDFRESMVEVIMEEQLFGEEGLERLLGCFLSLNSADHHGVILEVLESSPTGGSLEINSGQ
ncbi:hypothetical protein RJ639_005372 [Escallonia herrerae]|uniref:Transcription repressor n=1 Tax=Escallonia herrerae TaxID=1293975 RepID=A0AA89ATM0_9ASTE|nr:hypothetical protein RJ639_005372 [Escallonia herrerae]